MLARHYFLDFKSCEFIEEKFHFLKDKGDKIRVKKELEIDFPKLFSLCQYFEEESVDLMTLKNLGGSLDNVSKSLNFFTHFSLFFCLFFDVHTRFFSFFFVQVCNFFVKEKNSFRKVPSKEIDREKVEVRLPNKTQKFVYEEAKG